MPMYHLDQSYDLDTTSRAVRELEVMWLFEK